MGARVRRPVQRADRALEGGPTETGYVTGEDGILCGYLRLDADRQGYSVAALALWEGWTLGSCVVEVLDSGPVTLWPRQTLGLARALESGDGGTVVSDASPTGGTVEVTGSASGTTVTLRGRAVTLDREEADGCASWLRSIATEPRQARMLVLAVNAITSAMEGIPVPQWDALDRARGIISQSLQRGLYNVQNNGGTRQGRADGGQDGHA